MRHVRDLSGAEVMELVRARLARHPIELEPGEHRPGRARYPGDRHASLDDATRHAEQQFELRRQRFAPEEQADAALVERARRRFVYHHRQRHPAGFRSSELWDELLAALPDAASWHALAQGLEDRGQRLEANRAIAAARWLDVSLGPDALVDRSGPDTPMALDPAPDPDFGRAAFDKRHWNAWATWDPRTLLAHECDESFSVRTRIYRSLGHACHPAAIPALHEALHDPHPFACKQAARSLGHIADPTAVEPLRLLAGRHPDPDVRRVAARAIQRILGYWWLHGRWVGLGESPAQLVAAIEELAEVGLGGFALELVEERGTRRDDDPAWRALAERLAPESLAPPDLEHPPRHYHAYFAAARAEEAALVASDPADAERLLGSSDDAERLRALDLVSHHRLVEHVTAVRALVAEPGPIGWSARRTLRRLRAGRVDERRRPLRAVDVARAAPPVPCPPPAPPPAPRAPPTELSISCSEDASGIVLRLAGALDERTAAQLRAVFDPLLEPGAGPPIVLDLSALELLDEDGVALVVGMYQRLRFRQRVLGLRSAAGQPQIVLRALRLDRVIPVL